MYESFSDKLLKYGALCVILSLFVPLIAMYARMQTSLLVGGYLPEGEYVWVNASSETPVRFTIDKDNKAGMDYGYAVKIGFSKYNIFYSRGSLRMTTHNVGNPTTYYPNENIISRKDGVFYLKSHVSDKAPIGYFTKADSEKQYEKMLELRDEFNSR